MTSQVQNEAVLACFASGRVTGCVLSSGCDATNAVSVYEGYALPHTVTCVDVAGRKLTDYMVRVAMLGRARLWARPSLVSRF